MAKGMFDICELVLMSDSKTRERSYIRSKPRSPRRELQDYFIVLSKEGADITDYKNTFFPAANPIKPNKLRGIYGNGSFEIIARYIFGILPRIDTTIRGDAVTVKKLKDILGPNF